MAPSPDNITARLWVGYTSQSIRHEMLFRFENIVTTPDAIDFFDAMAPILAGSMFNSDSVDACRLSQPGDTFSLDVPIIPLTGSLTGGSGTRWTEDPESAFVSICYRETTTGRNGRYQFFCPLNWANAGWPSINRYNAGTNSQITGLRTDFDALLLTGAGGSGPVTGITGGPISLKSYTNIAKNAYTQRRQR